VALQQHFEDENQYVVSRGHNGAVRILENDDKKGFISPIFNCQKNPPSNNNTHKTPL
jgi:hypothetical protein